MANAGNHNDTRLLKRMIRDGKLIKVLPNDHPIAKKIKTRFNEIVIHDEPYNYHFGGRKYLAHKAWDKMTKTSIWVNQLRWKHYYFEPIS